MQMYRRAHETDKANPQLGRAQATLRRAMFTVSLLLRHFDFNDEAVYAGLRVRERTLIFSTYLVTVATGYTLWGVRSVVTRDMLL